MNDETGEFPFDFWARLAREDPGAFEDARRLMIDSLIDAAPSGMQPRLKGLQWRIDHIRSKAATPLSACLKISDMMWTNVLGEGGLAAQLKGLSEGDLTTPAPRPAADVLPFPSRPLESGDAP